MNSFLNCKCIIYFYKLNSLDKPTLLQLIKLVTKEPDFNDMPTRCFTLPFIATEAVCINSQHLFKFLFEDEDYALLNALMEFVDVPEEKQLNSTLCGYFNKIISFWLIKNPN